MDQDLVIKLQEKYDSLTENQKFRLLKSEYEANLEDRWNDMGDNEFETEVEFLEEYAYDDGIKSFRFNHTCPKCESENLEYYSIEPVDNQMMQKIDCNDCDHNFKIWSHTDWEYEEEETKCQP